MKTKIGISIALLLYSFYHLSTIDQWHFIDNVNLVIHEAGHWIFMPFGEFLMIAGGTILQLLVPAVFAGYFFLRGERYSGSLVLYWLSWSLFNAGHYAADAMVMQLPLLGGDTSGHDWNNMLIHLGWLRHTKFIANTIFTSGVITACAACWLSWRALRMPEKIDPATFTANPRFQ